jgi:transposase-like protein
VRHKQLRRLSGEQIEDMVEQYRNGKTVYELAPSFGIARQTVGIILRRQGVDTRDGRHRRHGQR